MTWNFHQYFVNRSDGLIAKLRLSDDENANLKKLRTMVRARTKEVFEEAKVIARKTQTQTLTYESIRAEISHTHLRYLSQTSQKEIASLIMSMDARAMNAFLALTPRFRSQGSFQYDTLNRPYISPPQEMDIDDGTYLPMEMFDERPIIGHRLLILLVDSSLTSLEIEHQGWKFIPKRTCARLQISQRNIHVDVPMYAVPAEEFMQKEAALKSQLKMLESSHSYLDLNQISDGDYDLDSNSVNLALREGDEKWIKSDPKIVEDWFNKSCKRIGKHLRNLCRFMKSWRDAQWENGGGPSSIALMVATVSVLDSIPHDHSDLGETMRLLVTELPNVFSAGIKSPDHTSESYLFPPAELHSVDEKQIIDRLINFGSVLTQATSASTKTQAMTLLSHAFGDRVTNQELILKTQSATAFLTEPTVGVKPKHISPTMSSG